MSKVIGLTMVLLAFIFIFGLSFSELGLVKALFVWGVAIVVTLVLTIGMFLLFRD